MKNYLHKKSFTAILALAVFLFSFPTWSAPSDANQSALNTEIDASLQAWAELARQTPVNPNEYDDAIRALADSAGIDLSAPEDQKSLFQEIKESLKEDVTKVKIQSKASFLTRLVLFGHKRALYKKYQEIVEKLSIPGEPNYLIKVSPSLMPSAYVTPTSNPPVMVISFGLLALSPSEDALAGVIAHEMTHAHKELFKGDADVPFIDDVLSNMDSYKGLRQSQREEIRADIGAVHRLLKAGYNPWGIYDFMKLITDKTESLVDQKIMNYIISKVSKKSASYIADHPAGEIRMAAIKAYILFRSGKEDISDRTSKYHKFSLPLKILRMRAQAITLPMMNKWVNRGIWAYTGYSLLSMVGITDFEFARQMGHIISEVTGPALEPIKYGFHTLGELLAPAWEPIKTFFSMAASSLTSDIHINEAIARNSLIGVISIGSVFIYDMLFFQIPMTFEFRNFKTLVKVNFDRIKLSKMIKYLIRKEREGVLDPNVLLRVMKLQIAHYKKIEYFYHQNSTIYFHRIRDGLSLSQAMASWNISRTLDLALRYGATLPENGKTAFYNDFYKSIELLPSSLLAKESLRDLLEIMLKINHVENLERLSAMPDLKKTKGRLTLLKFAEENASKLSPGDQLQLAKLLLDTGFLSEARALVMPNYKKIYTFVFSTQNSDPKLADLFTKIISQVKDKGTLSAPGLLGRLAMEQKITHSNLAAAAFTTQGPTAIAKHYTATGEVAFSTHRWLSLRYWIQRGEKQYLQNYFERNFNSVTSLRDFIEKELRPQNVRLDQLSHIFNAAISKHPEWIKSPADFKALINAEYFWPTFQTEGMSPGSYEAAIVKMFESLAKRYPETWKYEPASADRLHHLYIQQLKALNIYPTSYDGLSALWDTLVKRGVTSATDALFASLHKIAPPDKIESLEDLALNGKVWENEIRAKIIKKRVYQSKDYQDLISSTDRQARLRLLDKIIKRVRKDFPETGNTYREILEQISQDIQSTSEESKIIHDAKNISNGEKQEDLSLRVFSDFISKVTKWTKSEQWNLILFLRGDEVAGPRIQEAFKLIGPERVKRMFSLFPQLVRTQLLDSLLDSPRGLIPHLKPNSGYGKIMIDHLLKDSKPESRQIAGELLEAFLYSLEATGNKALQSYILSYLYAMPKGQQSTGHILKSVLEVFGTAGVKIGQFLAASQLLPEEETRYLRELQERANPPERQKIYDDLREVTNGKDLLVKLEKLLGSASLKYAVSAIELISKRRIVLKVLRIEAIANTQMQFKQLEKMAEYLAKKHGAKYGVFKLIVSASKAAVERELSLKGESLKSKVIGQRVYENSGSKAAVIKAPKEILLSDRLLGAEFADGSSIFEVEESRLATIASEILRVEGENLFKDLKKSDDTIIFDPDRHAGNFRVSAKGNGTVEINPIDFGQVQTITKLQRDQVFDIFALSQILVRTGSTDWALAQIQKIFNLNATASKKVKSTLGRYFPSQNLKEVTAYYSLLAALFDAGVRTDIVFVDYIRGIIQLSQYENLAKGGNVESSSARLEREVRKRAESMVSEMTLTKFEMVKAGVSEAKRSRSEKTTSPIRSCSKVFL